MDWMDSVKTYSQFARWAVENGDVDGARRYARVSAVRFRWFIEDTASHMRGSTDREQLGT